MKKAAINAAIFLKGAVEPKYKKPPTHWISGDILGCGGRI
jgi:hypothetical protein